MQSLLDSTNRKFSRSFEDIVSMHGLDQPFPRQLACTAASWQHLALMRSSQQQILLPSCSITAA